MGSSDENTNVQNPVSLGTLVGEANECIHDSIHKKNGQFAARG